MKFRDSNFWLSLLTVLSTLGFVSLTDARLLELSDQFVQLIEYGGLVLAGIFSALGIRSESSKE